jgi:hypothetical protein
MIQTHALISLYGLGIAKKAGLFVVVDAKSVARLKGRWSDGNDVMELSPYDIGWYAGFLFKRKIIRVKPYSDFVKQNP